MNIRRPHTTTTTDGLSGTCYRLMLRSSLHKSIGTGCIHLCVIKIAQPLRFGGREGGVYMVCGLGLTNYTLMTSTASLKLPSSAPSHICNCVLSTNPSSQVSMISTAAPHLFPTRAATQGIDVRVRMKGATLLDIRSVTPNVTDTAGLF